MLILGLKFAKTPEKLEAGIKKVISIIVSNHIKPESSEKIPYHAIGLISNKLFNRIKMDMFVIKILSFLMSLVSSYSTYLSFEELFLNNL
jgi:hypothetical protein